MKCTPRCLCSAPLKIFDLTRLLTAAPFNCFLAIHSNCIPTTTKENNNSYRSYSLNQQTSLPSDFLVALTNDFSQRQAEEYLGELHTDSLELKNKQQAGYHGDQFDKAAHGQ